jgi:hypothetical protein
MSNDLAMTMGELEAESAELLPSRETLCVSKWGGHGGNTTTIVSNGNTVQNGFLNLSFLNGDNVNILGIANQL